MKLQGDIFFVRILSSLYGVSGVINLVSHLKSWMCPPLEEIFTRLNPCVCEHMPMSCSEYHLSLLDIFEYMLRLLKDFADLKSYTNIKLYYLFPSFFP